MGGGDLNTKKSWHPNTMKNQERVWKAEQAAAEEQKRIQQLMVERNQERDRSELNDLARKRKEMESSDDARLGWMYERPEKQIQQEDYLLGKAIDKNFEKDENADKNVIPAVARRVVGSSMLSSTSDTQVDITRKMREDPLLMVKERERAARAALLNNPLQRKKIAELLRKEQEKKQLKKIKKSSKNKDDDLDRKLAEKLGALGGKKDINLASLLCSDDDDSSDDSSPMTKKKKKEKSKKKTRSESDKQSKKRTIRIRSLDSSHSSDECSSSPRKITKRDSSQQEYHKNKTMAKKFDQSQHLESRSSSKDDRSRTYERDHREAYKTHQKSDKKHKYDSGDERKKDNCRFAEKSNDDRKKYDKKYHEKRNNDSTRYDKTQEESRTIERNYDRSSKDMIRDKRNEDRRITTTRDRHCDKSHVSSQDRDRRTESTRKEGQRSEQKQTNEYNNRKRKSGLSDEEKAARLSAMSAAGAERERDRARRVAASIATSEKDSRVRSAMPPPRAALPESLEARIHSNRHNIQRNERHMDQHFARR